jgi:hypothetical protein
MSVHLDARDIFGVPVATAVACGFVGDSCSSSTSPDLVDCRACKDVAKSAEWGARVADQHFETGEHPPLNDLIGYAPEREKEAFMLTFRRRFEQIKVAP